MSDSSIVFTTAEAAIRFWEDTYKLSAAANQICPKLILETTRNITKNLPPRGSIRFNTTDLPTLEALWHA